MLFRVHGSLLLENIEKFRNFYFAIFRKKIGMRAGTWAQERPEGVEMRVFIQPRASKTEIVGLLGEALKIRIAAPPVDGQANAVLIRFLAHYLRIPQTHVQVIKGMNAKQKRIFIRGASLKHIQALLRSNSA